MTPLDDVPRMAGTSSGCWTLDRRLEGIDRRSEQAGQPEIEQDEGDDQQRNHGQQCRVSRESFRPLTSKAVIAQKKTGARPVFL